MRRDVAALRRELEQPTTPAVGDVPHRRQRDPRDIEDKNYRRAYGQLGRQPFGRPLRAAFYAYLPDVPRTRYLPHGLADFACYYLKLIREVQEMQCWSRREQERLRVLERRWSRRAAGQDARYNMYGTAPGPHTPRDRIAELRQELTRDAAPAPRSAFDPWRPK